MLNQQGVNEGNSPVQIKSVEDVMKWSVTDPTKVMLIQNIVNGNLKLSDPKLIEYLKTQNMKDETHGPLNAKSLDLLYCAPDIITNMVFFNDHICFTVKGDTSIYTFDPQIKEFKKTLVTRNQNVTCLAVGNGYLYAGDEKGGVTVFHRQWNVMAHFSPAESNHSITSMFTAEGKLYVGNNQGMIFMFDALGANRVSFSTQHSGPVTHIVKFDRFIVSASKRKFHLETLDDSNKSRHYGECETNGNILLLTIENSKLSIYTSGGRVQIDSVGSVIDRDGIYEMYGTYKTPTYILNHKGRILNAHDGSIFDKTETEIVSHIAPRIGYTKYIIAFIHDNKLYSTGADCCIRVTDL